MKLLCCCGRCFGSCEEEYEIRDGRFKEEKAKQVGETRDGENEKEMKWCERGTYGVGVSNSAANGKGSARREKGSI